METVWGYNYWLAHLVYKRWDCTECELVIHLEMYILDQEQVTCSAQVTSTTAFNPPLPDGKERDILWYQNNQLPQLDCSLTFLSRISRIRETYTIVKCFPSCRCKHFPSNFKELNMWPSMSLSHFYYQHQTKSVNMKRPVTWAAFLLTWIPHVPSASGSIWTHRTLSVLV